MPIGKSDAQGKFSLRSLPAELTYTLLIDAPGYQQSLLHKVKVGNTNLQAKLVSLRLINGIITGKLSNLERSGDSPAIVIRAEFANAEGETTSSYGKYLPVKIEGGVGKFTFTNKFGNALSADVNGQNFNYKPNDENTWKIVLPAENPFKRREVVLRFRHPSGVPPTGTIYASVAHAGSDSVYREEMEIKNGEVRALAKVGYFSYEPARTVGYWFPEQSFINVPEGKDPYIIDVPVTPAGAIYATVRDADGSPAKNVSYSIIEVARSPIVTNTFVRVEMKDGVASPLPLGGTYRVRASRGFSICLSEPIKLTDKEPDRQITLQFSPGRNIEGSILKPDGSPLPNASIEVDWQFATSAYGYSPSISTDQSGRFVIPEASDTKGGRYRLIVRSAGLQSQIVPVTFAALPLTIRTQPGRKIIGKVVEKKSGLPIPDAPIHAYSYKGTVPSERTLTDEKGNFVFNTLDDTEYMLNVQGANYDVNGSKPIRPDEQQPIILEMVIPEWSKLKVASQQ